jgi:phosphocarrier protein
MGEQALPDENTQVVTTTLFVHDDLGLHARPAARLAQTARQYQSRITVEYDDVIADAKSILDFLCLSAGRGALLTVRCAGVDARKAADDLEGLFSAEGEMSAWKSKENID